MERAERALCRLARLALAVEAVAIVFDLFIVPGSFGFRHKHFQDGAQLLVLLMLAGPVVGFIVASTGVVAICFGFASSQERCLRAVVLGGLASLPGALALLVRLTPHGIF